MFLLKKNRIGSLFLAGAIAVLILWPFSVSGRGPSSPAGPEVEESKQEDSQKVDLTPEERAFLLQIGPIKMCVDPDWEPYEKINHLGEYEGIAPDLLALVSRRLGIELVLYPTVDWKESVETVKSGKAHILAFLNQTPAREEWLVFTAPYFSDPNVFITREDHEFIADPARLSGETIVFPEGTSMEELVRTTYPDLKISVVPTEEEAFSLVRERKADMTLRSLTMAAYTIRKEGLFNLKIAGQLPGFTNNFRMGVVKDLPMLRDILDKGVRTISPRDVQQAVNKHISISVQTGIDYVLIIRIVLAFSLVLAVGLYWNYRLRKHSEHLRLIIDAVPAYIFARDVSGKFILANKAVAEVFGVEPEEVVGKTDREYGATEEQVTAYLAADISVIQGGQPLEIPEEQVLRKDRSLGWFRTTKIPYRHPDHKVPSVLGVAVDITDLKEAEIKLRESEERYRQLAQHDGLTGLPNRELFSDLLNRALALAKRERTRLALMFLDLDKFKPVNDTYGHAAGDLVLKETALRILSCIRASDTAGRIGGDEFVLFLHNVEGPGGVRNVAEKILLAVERPIMLNHQELRVSCSIGIAFYPDHGKDEKTLSRHADLAMYRAKSEGGRSIEGYTPESDPSG